MIAPLAALIRLHEIQSEAPVGDEITHRPAEKNRMLQAMSANLHKRYLRVYRKHGISAVSPMERNICTGCFMRQPVGLPEIEEDIYECQSCGRLLYDPDIAYEYSVG